MAGLLGSLSMAARALDAQRFGLDVTGQNIANVNTPGYARREAQFASVPPYEKLSAGEGVEVTGMHAVRDERLERRLQQERPAEQRELAIADSLGVVEAALGKTGASIDSSMSAFFDSLGRLAADPTSAVARREVASQGDALSASFRDMSGRLDQATRDADVAIRGAVNQVNTLAGTIARLNAALGAAAGGAPGKDALKDQLGDALKSLSGLIDIGTIPRPDGGVDVSFGNGHPLVIGANTYALDATSTPPSGFASLGSAGVDVTSEITGGTIGGLLQVRDVLVPGYQNQLDTLAYGIVQQVNAVHQSGYDLSGATGADFFTPLASSANAARAISVSAGILADPGTIATGATAVAGDNDVARKLADLRDARGLSGGTATFSDAWGTLVYQVGADSRAAQDEQTSRAEIVKQVELLREQVSGVSLDEEAMMMMKFQRAYEANARFFQAIDSALETLLSLKR
jgi:flagellar hook-associated protein 1 FlgK